MDKVFSIQSSLSGYETKLFESFMTPVDSVFTFSSELEEYVSNATLTRQHSYCLTSQITSCWCYLSAFDCRYKSVAPRLIDFGTIISKIIEARYGTIQEAINDVELLAANCRAYWNIPNKKSDVTVRTAQEDLLYIYACLSW